MDGTDEEALGLERRLHAHEHSSVAHQQDLDSAAVGVSSEPLLVLVPQVVGQSLLRDLTVLLRPELQRHLLKELFEEALPQTTLA